MIHSQKSRRNLSKEALLRLVELFDKRKPEGRPPKTTPPDVVSQGPTSNNTAKSLGVSPRTVERVRTILDHGTEDLKEKVRVGIEFTLLNNGRFCNYPILHVCFRCIKKLKVHISKLNFSHGRKIHFLVFPYTSYTLNNFNWLGTTP